jgi:hypothetical protein
MREMRFPSACVLRCCQVGAAIWLTLVCCAGCSLPGGANAGVVEIESPKPAGYRAKTGAPSPDALALAAQPGSSDVPPPGSGFPPIAANDGFSNQPASLNNGGDDFNALSKQLQGLSGLDPAERQALLDDLKQSDPALWPQLVRQFRTALAYRNRTALAGGNSSPPSGTDQALDEGDVLPPQTIIHLEPQPPAAKTGRKESAAANDALDAHEPSNVAVKKPMPRKSAATDQAGDVSPATATAPIVRTSALSKSSARAASDPQPGSDQWQLQLTKTILALESNGDVTSGDAAEISRQIQLRLLYLAAGRRDDALKPIAGLSAAQQEFWTKELYGLATYLDADRVADPERRATEAALHLREAAGRIGELANPVVRNLAFCKEVTSFGVYKKFPKYEFKAGDEVLLYGEIENLKAESTDRGYHTAVKSSYQILDGRGERIAEQEFPVSDDLCTSPRRDFFIPYFIWLPKHINDGAYTLQLTIEDKQTKKIGQSSIQFTVK